jgi:hypothetical protein
MTKTLLPSVGLAHIASALAAGPAIDDDSTIIDIAEFEGALFMVPIEDSANGGTATLTVEQNDVNSGVGMAALAGAEASLTSAADDDLNGQMLAVDIYRPSGRYLRVNRASAGANIAFGAVTVILYGPRKMPVSEAAGLTVVASPDPS